MKENSKPAAVKEPPVRNSQGSLTLGFLVLYNKLIWH